MLENGKQITISSLLIMQAAYTAEVRFRRISREFKLIVSLGLTLDSFLPQSILRNKPG